MKDETRTFTQVMDLVDDGVIPLIGPKTSLGVNKPPLIIFLFAIPYLFSKKIAVMLISLALVNILAVYLCYRLGKAWFGTYPALIAAALFAVSPWAVVFSRRLCDLCIGAIFTIGWLWSLGGWVKERRPAMLAPVLIFPAGLMSLHWGALVAGPYLILIWLVFQPPVRTKPLILGVLGFLLVLGPFFYYEWREDFMDFRNIFVFLRGGGNEPDKSLLFLFTREFRETLDIMGDGQLENVLRTGADAFRAKLIFPHPLRWIEPASFVAGILYLVGQGASALRLQRAFPYLTVKAYHYETLMILWCIVYWMIFALPKIGTAPHYFTLLYPIPYLVVGVFFQRLGVWFRWLLSGRMARVLKWSPAALVLLIVGSQVAFTLRFREALESYVKRYPVSGEFQRIRPYELMPLFASVHMERGKEAFENKKPRLALRHFRQAQRYYEEIRILTGGDPGGEDVRQWIRRAEESGG